MREIAISEDELNRRITAVERLTKLYSAERKVHLFATSASIIILLGAAIMMLYRGQAGLTEIGSLFGAGGLYTYSAKQVMGTLDRTVNAVVLLIGGANEKNGN